MKYFFLLFIGTYCFNAYAPHDIRQPLIVALLLHQVVEEPANNQEVTILTKSKKLAPKYKTKKTQQPKLPKTKRYWGKS